MLAIRHLTSAGKPNLCNKLVSGCGVCQRAHTTSAAKFAIARHRTLVPIALLMVALCSAAAQAQEKSRNCRTKGRMRARRSSTVSYLHSRCNQG